MSDEMKTRSVTMRTETWAKIKESAKDDLRQVNAQMEILICEALEARQEKFIPDLA